MERKNITNLQLSEAEVKNAIAYYLEQREGLGVHPRDIQIEMALAPTDEKRPDIVKLICNGATIQIGE